MRYVAPMMMMVGSRLRRLLYRRAEIDRLFVDHDLEARRDYDRRAESSTGILMPPGQN
jgi:hypothetical protein